jgi:predicted transcriptional regulator
MSHDRSATADRALSLLGQGLSTSVVASALGVSDARVSQLLADPDFAAQVQKARFESLQQSTAIDSKYNELEDALLGKLKKVMPLISRPRDILQAISTVNSAKRRGQSTPDTDALQAKVVNLTLPQIVQQKFIQNNYQQVVEVRDESGNSQSLVTASSGSLDGFAKEMLDRREEERNNEQARSQKFLESSDEETTQSEPRESSGSKKQTSLADYL